jgi:hypothetical protein
MTAHASATRRCRGWSQKSENSGRRIAAPRVSYGGNAGTAGAAYLGRYSGAGLGEMPKCALTLAVQTGRESRSRGVKGGYTMLIHPHAGHRDALSGLPCSSWPLGPVTRSHGVLLEGSRSRCRTSFPWPTGGPRPRRMPSSVSAGLSGSRSRCLTGPVPSRSERMGGSRAMPVRFSAGSAEGTPSSQAPTGRLAERWDRGSAHASMLGDMSLLLHRSREDAMHRVSFSGVMGHLGRWCFVATCGASPTGQ